MGINMSCLLSSIFFNIQNRFQEVEAYKFFLDKTTNVVLIHYFRINHSSHPKRKEEEEEKTGC